VEPPVEDIAMTTVVFVHGTGVREPVATDMYEKIRQKLSGLKQELTVTRCNWGGNLGTRLYAGGVTIPEYASTRDIGDNDRHEEEPLADTDYLVPLWELLAQANATRRKSSASI